MCQKITLFQNNTNTLSSQHICNWLWSWNSSCALQTRNLNFLLSWYAIFLHGYYEEDLTNFGSNKMLKTLFFIKCSLVNSSVCWNSVLMTVPVHCAHIQHQTSGIWLKILHFMALIGKEILGKLEICWTTCSVLNNQKSWRTWWILKMLEMVSLWSNISKMNIFWTPCIFSR